MQMHLLALSFPQASSGIDPSTRRLNRTEWLAVECHLRRGSVALERLVRFVFIIGPLVLCLARGKETDQDADDENEPEDIDSLQDSEETKRDDLRNPALILLRVPVEFVRPNSRELAIGEQRGEDSQVDVVTKVSPDNNEKAKVAWCNPCIDVVEAFGSLSRFVSTDKHRADMRLTARKKSEMSCVIYTATPI